MRGGGNSERVEGKERESERKEKRKRRGGGGERMLINWEEMSTCSP